MIGAQEMRTRRPGTLFGFRSVICDSQLMKDELMRAKKVPIHRVEHVSRHNCTKHLQSLFAIMTGLWITFKVVNSQAQR